jgi:predicted phage terminase large subunit-like protein
MLGRALDFRTGSDIAVFANKGITDDGSSRITGNVAAVQGANVKGLNRGNVKLVAGEWNKEFIEELRKFPRGKNDDQVDAVSLAFNAANQPSKAWSTMPFRLV